MKKDETNKFRIRWSNADLEEFKAFLGPLVEDYTDLELRQLGHKMQAMAGILLDFCLRQKKGSDLPAIDF